MKAAARMEACLAERPESESHGWHVKVGWLLSLHSPPLAFGAAITTFDASIGRLSVLGKSLVPVHGEYKTDLQIRNNASAPLEEYYKWQFIYGIINSGLYAKDYIGAEVFFPKGTSTLKIDAAIFDDPDWITRYQSYWRDRRIDDLQWLNDHLLAVVEFKRAEEDIAQVFSRQVKPAMKEKEPSDAYVLGTYYDAGRLFLFQRRGGKFLRYDEPKNQKGDASQVGDLSLHLPDPYSYIPSFSELKNLVHRPNLIDRANRGIADLGVITSIATVQVQAALSHTLKALERVSLADQRGYHILIEAFALKIFDEKRNNRNANNKLEFYVTPAEEAFSSLASKEASSFIKRMKGIWTDAEDAYHRILGEKQINWQNENHVRSVVAVCSAFQDFSFVRSAQTDLYQLIFYNFANAFKRMEAGQFLTPLPVIEFLVKIVNPRNDETVVDPCCGIADFLSVAFVSSRNTQPLSDTNIFGVDLDDTMITLATLNMLLNGDGAATLLHRPDKGSILAKIAVGNPAYLVDLIPEQHAAGNWDEWPDRTKLMKFDVVLTNPPFGQGRSYEPANEEERSIIECYETWPMAGGDSIDKGIIFLENAYRILKDEGRLGIVLSNSIASINQWEKVRQWLMDKMRIVALFDLPPNVFAETGVAPTLIVAYKPKARDLARLNNDGYSIFVRDVHRIGYERRTSKRNVYFKDVYRIDEASFDVQINALGIPIKDEEFTQTIADFRVWVLAQEETLQKLFLKEK
jgi:type I restriction enzyme M protein